MPLPAVHLKTAQSHSVVNSLRICVKENCAFYAVVLAASSGKSTPRDWRQKVNEGPDGSQKTEKAIVSCV